MTSLLFQQTGQVIYKKPLAVCQKILKNKIWGPVCSSDILRPTCVESPCG